MFVRPGAMLSDEAETLSESEASDGNFDNSNLMAFVALINKEPLL
jgi:hypothetical protein